MLAMLRDPDDSTTFLLEVAAVSYEPVSFAVFVESVGGCCYVLPHVSQKEYLDMCHRFFFFGKVDLTDFSCRPCVD